MGIFGAMMTAVSGLRSQSFALQNISGNIANSQTVGFKRTDTTFADLVSDTGSSQQQRSGSVRALSRATNGVQGGIERSEISTHMAINGDGWFVLSERTGVVDGRPIFSQESFYTRRGDFELDKDGYLVNGAGYYLKALPVDPTTGNPSSSIPQPIQLTSDFLPAKQTTEIVYRANLADFPLTANADPDVANSEILPGTLTISPSVAGADQTTFLNNSISGGAVTVYDPTGAPVNVQFRWGKTTNAPDTWNLFYLTDAAATGATPAWNNVGTDFIFNANGQLAPAISQVTMTGVSVGGIALGDINLSLGNSGLTQYADPNGNAQVNSLSQDGYAAGEVIGINIGEGGRIVASYSNGQAMEVARVPLAGFMSEASMQKIDGGAFRATIESGPAILGATGRIAGSSHEASNTDIAAEFSKLIVTQQAYSANTRIVSTSDQMMQEVLNMKR